MLDFIVTVLQIVGLALLVTMAWAIYWKAGVGSAGAALLLVGYLLGRPSEPTP